jgi:hypothetical protein
MTKFIRIGVDLAKNYFQVHALESQGCSILYTESAMQQCLTI